MPDSDAYPQPDIDLVRRVVAGNADAVDWLGQRLSCVPRILARLNAGLGLRFEPHELEDVQQDVVMVIWRKLQLFEGRSSLGTWIYQICHLELMTARRRRRLGTGRELGLLDPDASPGPTAPDPLRFQGLYQGLARLPEEELRIVRCKHYDDRTFDEIALELGLSPSQIKTRYYRAMTKLRAWVHDDERTEGTR